MTIVSQASICARIDGYVVNLLQRKMRRPARADSQSFEKDGKSLPIREHSRQESGRLQQISSCINITNMVIDSSISCKGGSCQQIYPARGSL